MQHSDTIINLFPSPAKPYSVMNSNPIHADCLLTAFPHVKALQKTNFILHLCLGHFTGFLFDVLPQLCHKIQKQLISSVQIYASVRKFNFLYYLRVCFIQSFLHLFFGAPSPTTSSTPSPSFSAFFFAWLKEEIMLVICCLSAHRRRLKMFSALWATITFLRNMIKTNHTALFYTM